MWKQLLSFRTNATISQVGFSCKLDYLILGSATRGPPGCILQHAATFVKYVYVKLKDRKRPLSAKNDHKALWHLRKGYNAKFRVVGVFKQPQRIVSCEDMQ